MQDRQGRSPIDLRGKSRGRRKTPSQDKEIGTHRLFSAKPKTTFRLRKYMSKEEDTSQVLSAGCQSENHSKSPSRVETGRELREVSTLLERRVMQRLFGAMREELRSPLPASQPEFPYFQERVQVHAEQALKATEAQISAVQEFADFLLTM